MDTTSGLKTALEPPRFSVTHRFDLSGHVVVVTGGAGLLGRQHAEAIAEAGGVPVIADVRGDAARGLAEEIAYATGGTVGAIQMDVTNKISVERALREIVGTHGRVSGLVNNAALNPKVEGGGLSSSRLETLSLERFRLEVDVGLSGAFLCSQVFGTHMAETGGGVIVNISSDLGIIAPDQRIYERAGTSEAEQPKKTVTYSVIKGGLVMLTKYLATYWAESDVRVNTLSPGGVFAGQPEDFIEKLTNLIPMGRMARPDEYKAALVFLLSDASSYMTGSNLVIDGGRTCW